MADQQQLDLLLQGVPAWNKWRTQQPERHPDLSKANLGLANLSGVNLSRADLSGVNLSFASLEEANLYKANLSEADLVGAALNRTNLSEAVLNVANLYKADLSEADLSGADLSGARLIRVGLSRTNLSKSTVALTIFGDIDLRTVKGLETVRHVAPSIIGVDTLLRSQGDIPEQFLRKAGLTDAFIMYVRSLAQKPIEYYTCFISYSSKDQEFVERLYADLQARGVRCWYAPEDLKIGDAFRERIDESIRLYDKLLVILSQHSIDSSWVEYEVNAALQKEQEQAKPVLFPIILDEALRAAPDAWAAAIQQTRHMGDFTQWKEHDAYQKSLKRLIRDLQPDAPIASKA